MQLLNKSKYPRTVLLKRKGNERGNAVTVSAGCSISLPNDPNIIFYDTLNMMEIPKKSQIVINKDGAIEP